jgi:hypothetical protein
MFKTNLQIFAGIAWIIGVFSIAFSAYSDLSTIDKAANAEKFKDVIVTYLQMLALTTGICMGAWGIPFYNWRNPSYKPFAVGDEKKKK